MKYLLGLLNSTTFDFCHKLRHAEYIRGGWFVRYGFVFDCLPIRKTSEEEESKIVHLVDDLIEVRSKIIKQQNNLKTVNSMIETSEITTVTAGLSRLLSTEREGGDKTVTLIRRVGSTVYFNKEKTVSIECVSEVVSSFVENYFKKELDSFKNKTLNEVLSSLQLPKDESELNKLETYKKQSQSDLESLKEKFRALKANLDSQVARIYKLSDEEFELMNRMLGLITTEEISIQKVMDK